MDRTNESLSLSPKISSSVELPSQIEMAQDIAKFNKKYAVFSEKIGNAIGHDFDTTRSLIAHESRFQIDAKNIHGSKGLMQLTSSPIDDLGARANLYAPFFQKIALTDLPPDTPIELKKLLEAFKQEKPDIKTIRALLPSIKRLKSEPIVNLTIGNIFLASLESRSSPRTESRKAQVPETLTTILENSTLTAHVFKRIRHILPGVSPEEVVQTVRQLQTNPEKFGEFLAIRDYNGNNQDYGSRVRHSDIYACVVLWVKILSENNPAYLSRIRGNTSPANTDSLIKK